MPGGGDQVGGADTGRRWVGCGRGGGERAETSVSRGQIEAADLDHWASQGGGQELQQERRHDVEDRRPSSFQNKGFTPECRVY